MDNKSMRAIAARYAAAPLLDPAAIPAWKALAGHCWTEADRLRKSYRIVEVAYQPYLDVAAMFNDLDSGRLLVTTANSEHPLWSVQETVASRICHDILGHYAAHRRGELADFSWEGEVNAAFEQTLALPTTGRVRAAFFTEAVGQAAFALANGGEFGPQKVAFI